MTEELMDGKYCYIHARGNKPGTRIGIAKFRDTGYFQTDFDEVISTAEQVEEKITWLNTRLGISDEVRQAMEAGTMFGWHVPGAQAAIAHFEKGNHEQGGDAV